MAVAPARPPPRARLAALCIAVLKSASEAFLAALALALETAAAAAAPEMVAAATPAAAAESEAAAGSAEDAVGSAVETWGARAEAEREGFEARSWLIWSWSSAARTKS